jgi:translation initiation factor IF-1
MFIRSSSVEVVNGNQVMAVVPGSMADMEAQCKTAVAGVGKVTEEKALEKGKAPAKVTTTLAAKVKVMAKVREKVREEAAGVPQTAAEKEKVAEALTQEVLTGVSAAGAGASMAG